MYCVGVLAPIGAYRHTLSSSYLSPPLISLSSLEAGGTEREMFRVNTRTNPPVTALETSTELVEYMFSFIFLYEMLLSFPVTAIYFHPLVHPPL